MINFKKLENEKIAVLFDTRKEMFEFLKECEKNNIRWSEGDKATTKDCFDIRKELCISIEIEGLQYDRRKFYELDGYKVINYKDLNKKFTKSDLRNGDILTDREGCVSYFQNGVLIGKTCYIERLNDDLKDITGDKNNDIVKVERPMKLETVFERKEESTEMTIEEIEERLGIQKGTLRVKGVDE